MKSLSIFKIPFIATCFLIVSIPSTTAQLPFDIPPNGTILSLDSLEYFFDHDPGFGNGTKYAVSPGSDIMESVMVYTGDLSPGVHQMYVRLKDVSGKWSLSARKAFLKTTGGSIISFLSPNDIVQLEYFVDTDPGYGNGTPITITADTALSLSGIPAGIGSPGSGIHTFYIRTKDSKGNWSITSGQVFTILDGSFTIPPHVAKDSIQLLEYFIDTDPGIGNGTAIPVTAGIDITIHDIPVAVSGLDIGPHFLFTRTISRQTSVTQAKAFSIEEPLNAFWISADARYIDKDILINWEVTNDNHYIRYRIERANSDLGFSEIGQVPSKGSANGRYHFNDSSFSGAKLFYRIKAEKNDGSTIYSPVMQISIPEYYRDISVSNPCSSILKIFGAGIPQGPTVYKIYNTIGQVIMNGHLSKEETQGIQVGHLNSGSYILVIESNQEIKPIQFVKK